MKKLMSLIVIMTMVLTLGACSKSSKTYQLESLTESVVKDLVFEDTLSKVDSELLTVVYGLDAESIEESILYKGSGATAEEFVLLKLNSEEKAKAAYTVLEQYIVSQKEAFSSYVPEEVHRLEKAYLKQNGVYVFFCVAEDVEPFKTLVE